MAFENNRSLNSLLKEDLPIHVADLKERGTSKKALIEMGAQNEKIDEIIEESEKRENNSNQILDFTRQIKKIDDRVYLNIWK